MSSTLLVIAASAISFKNSSTLDIAVKCNPPVIYPNARFIDNSSRIPDDILPSFIRTMKQKIRPHRTNITGNIRTIKEEMPVRIRRRGKIAPVGGVPIGSRTNATAAVRLSKTCLKQPLYQVFEECLRSSARSRSLFDFTAFDLYEKLL